MRAQNKSLKKYTQVQYVTLNKHTNKQTNLDETTRKIQTLTRYWVILKNYW